MKKQILIGLLLTGGLFANGESIYKSKCSGCHGTNGQSSALGKSAIITGQDKDLTIKQMKEYKEGTLNAHGLGIVMKGQAQKLSDEETKAVSEYIANMK